MTRHLSKSGDGGGEAGGGGSGRPYATTTKKEASEQPPLRHNGNRTPQQRHHLRSTQPVPLLDVSALQSSDTDGLSRVRRAAAVRALRRAAEAHGVVRLAGHGVPIERVRPMYTREATA